MLKLDLRNLSSLFYFNLNEFKDKTKEQNRKCRTVQICRVSFILKRGDYFNNWSLDIKEEIK